MIPQIFNLGPIPINSFGLMIALAFIAGSKRLQIDFAARGLRPELADRYVVTGGIVGLIGARIWYLGSFWHEVREDLLGSVFASAGFVFYGGFIFSAIALFIMSRLDGIKLTSFLDALAPTLGLSYAIGRVGCQLSGDGDYGRVTDSFWGMSYAAGVLPTPPGVLVYPTPVFESLLALAVVAAVLFAQRYPFWRAPARPFGLYLVLISIERFVIEFLRIEPRVIQGFSQAQIIATCVAAVGLAMIVLRRSEGCDAPQVEG